MAPLLDIEDITTEKWDEVAKATSITTARGLLGDRPDRTPDALRVGPSPWRDREYTDPWHMYSACVELGPANKISRCGPSCRVYAHGRFSAYRCEQLAQALIEHAAWLRRNGHRSARVANYKRFPQEAEESPPLAEVEADALRMLVERIGSERVISEVERMTIEDQVLARETGFAAVADRLSDEAAA